MATTYGSAPVAHAVCRPVRKLLAGTRLPAQQSKHVLPGSRIDLDNPCVEDSGGMTTVNPDGSDSSYSQAKIVHWSREKGRPSNSLRQCSAWILSL